MENDENLRQTAREALEQEHYQVTGCATGQEALGAMFRSDPDVLITNIRVPDLEDLHLVITALSHRPRPRIIVLAEEPTDELVSAACGLGVEHVLKKPFPLEELLRTVRQLLPV